MQDRKISDSADVAFYLKALKLGECFGLGNMDFSIAMGEIPKHSPNGSRHNFEGEPGMCLKLLNPKKQKEFKQLLSAVGAEWHKQRVRTTLLEWNHEGYYVAGERNQLYDVLDAIVRKTSRRHFPYI